MQSKTIMIVCTVLKKNENHLFGVKLVELKMYPAETRLRNNGGGGGSSDSRSTKTRQQLSASERKGSSSSSSSNKSK